MEMLSLRMAPLPIVNLLSGLALLIGTGISETEVRFRKVQCRMALVVSTRRLHGNSDCEGWFPYWRCAKHYYASYRIEAPVIPAQSIVNTDQITVGDSVEISATFFDPDLESGIVAWLDKDAFVDSDGDGSVSNDRQWLLTGSLESFWDTDILLDEDGDGDPSNDFEWTRLHGLKLVSARSF